MSAEQNPMIVSTKTENYQSLTAAEGAVALLMHIQLRMILMWSVLLNNKLGETSFTVFVIVDCHDKYLKFKAGQRSDFYTTECKACNRNSITETVFNSPLFK